MGVADWSKIAESENRFGVIPAAIEFDASSVADTRQSLGNDFGKVRIDD